VLPLNVELSLLFPPVEVLSDYILHFPRLLPVDELWLRESSVKFVCRKYLDMLTADGRVFSRRGRERQVNFRITDGEYFKRSPFRPGKLVVLNVADFVFVEQGKRVVSGFCVVQFLYGTRVSNELFKR
jgi:hypothetical protein